MFLKHVPGVVALALLVPAVARGDVWTNAAGHAVEASLISIEHGMAVFTRPDGARLDMPLASLAPASRQRALESAGLADVPERLRTDYRLCVRTLKRLQDLHRAGELGDDEYSKQSEGALARLEGACARLEVPKDAVARLLLSARSF